MRHRRDRVSELLAQKFPTKTAVATEIINLNAILGLPKGTEHFLSDLHGEDEAFCQLLKNASGEIRLKMADVFSGILSEHEQEELAFLIYDPKKVLAQDSNKTTARYREILAHLIFLCRAVAEKYTRSKVRKALPTDFSYILEELLHTNPNTPDREKYHKSIIDAIIEEGQAEAFVCALCALISRLAVDHLHILGDIFDRGDAPHRILDLLENYHSVDLCWGNHDILWMGANLGNPLSVATAVRITLRYHHPQLLEQAYGIPLRNLFTLAEKLYPKNCSCFLPKGDSSADSLSVARAHKTISVIFWKLEEAFVKEHPVYEMEDSCTLGKIDWVSQTILVDGVSYPLADTDFPTVDPQNPSLLTAEEETVIQELCQSFIRSEKLCRHVRFMLAKGGMYQVMNGNLLYHGCVPLTEDGSFASFLGYRGRSLMDYCDKTVRKAFFLEKTYPEKQNCIDFFWYLWAGKNSPLFGKNGLKTLPRYLVADSCAHQEEKNPYYRLIEGENGKKIARAILSDFSLYKDTCKIVNGHVPVRQNRGESPQKADGILYMIDGGLSTSYHQKTGIGGYTLLYNSHGFFLTAHEPFSKKYPQKNRSHRVIGEKRKQRIRVADTDTGLILRQRIRELRRLMCRYQEGFSATGDQIEKKG